MGVILLSVACGAKDRSISSPKNDAITDRAEPQGRFEPATKAVATSIPRQEKMDTTQGSIQGDRIEIRRQTPEEAFEYLWQQLEQLPFYRTNGYRVSLPPDEEIDALARGETALANIDRAELSRRFFADIYDPRAFDSGLDALRSTPRVIAEVLPVFQRWHDAWGFEIPSRYLIVLTLYGPGGSYHPDRGAVTLWTDAEGRFKGSGGPAVIVHEMVHLGLENTIVGPFRLTHWEKERLVDLLCSHHFDGVLGGYHMQSKGTGSLDPYIDEAASSDLPAAIRRYVAENPR